jgi:hypothetical protein
MTINGPTSGQENPEDRLRSAQEECERLQKENAHLRAMLGIQELVRDGAPLPPGPAADFELWGIVGVKTGSLPPVFCGYKRVSLAKIHPYPGQAPCPLTGWLFAALPRSHRSSDTPTSRASFSQCRGCGRRRPARMSPAYEQDTPRADDRAELVIFVRRG